MSIIRIYITGVIVVLVAIIVNAAVEFIGLENWYGFLMNIAEHGLLSAVSEAGVVSLLFLFVIYPLTLGAAVVINEQRSRKDKSS